MPGDKKREWGERLVECIPDLLEGVFEVGGEFLGQFLFELIPHLFELIFEVIAGIFSGF